MGRIQRSFTLFRASLAVLRQRKALAVFPAISGAASLVVAVTFLVPAIALSPDAFDEDAAGPGLSPAGYALLFCMYAVLAMVTVFCNAALVHAADRALRGEEFTVGGSLRAARGRVRLILPWALLSATVSVVLRALEERLGILGRISVALVGLAWTLVTYLVLPLLVLEGVTVREALNRSASMFRRTWGERAAGNVGIGLAAVLLALVAVPFLVVLALLGPVGIALAVVLGALWMVGLLVVTGALAGIYQTALYRYASDGWTAPAFGGSDLPHAFPPRRSRRRR